VTDAPTDPAPVDLGLETTESDVDGRQARSPKMRPALICLSALVVYAGLSWEVVFLVLLVASEVADRLVVGAPTARAVLARGQFGIASRSLTRELLTVALLIGDHWAPVNDRRAAAVCILTVAGLRLLYQFALVVARRRLTPPVETVNVDLTGLRLPPTLPRVLLVRISERQHGLSAVALIAAAVAVTATVPPLVFAAAGLVIGVEVVALGALCAALIRGRSALGREALAASVQARVSALRPEAMLYHSGGARSAYQVNMWLSTMDRLPQSVVIVLRERACLQDLGATTTPVVCIPGSVDFMTFSLPDVRVAMYTANVGKAIHMLREPGVRHVFIGHGDSDKSASSNPFSKVYSEIWVAGEAGRDRYRRADAGIPDEDIVEVGRPQLDVIHPADPDAARHRPFSVLYAPTWEGWTNDPAHTSLVRTGPALIERLLAMPQVRVTYKPHPLTGSVTAAAAAADNQVRHLVTQAVHAAPDAGHSIATGAEPSLYDCFNDTDLLIADISSVITDFVKSQKPYVVVNLTDLDEIDFRHLYPSASAAYLLDPAADGIAVLLDLVRGPDPMRGARRDLMHYLMGPDEPSALSRFAAAIDAARDRAIACVPVRPLSSPADV
jgi:hypothetical protein